MKKSMFCGSINRFGILTFVFLFSEISQANSVPTLLDLSLRAVRRKILNQVVPHASSDPELYRNQLRDQPTLVLQMQDEQEALNIPVELKKKVIGKPVRIAAGSSHNLVLNESGEVLTFGSGVYGKLGQGNSQNLYFPKFLMTKTLQDQKFTQIAAGTVHSLLLSESGRIYSFGYGGNGQLGHGDFQDQLIPKVIEAELLNDQEIIQMTAGNFHNLFLSQSGRVYSFGCGASGQLGLGDNQNQWVPKWIDAEILRDQRVIQVAAGGEFSLILTEKGDLFSFGMGGSGQLGQGNLGNYRLPRRIAAESLKNHKILQIAAGSYHSLLLTNEGRVFTFGSGSRGQLGHGDTQNQLEPKLLETEVLKDHKVIRIAAGDHHSLLLTDKGRVFTFGEGSKGQLGHGDTLSYTIPKMIEAKPLHDQKITEIEGGAFHSLVLTENGDLYSFGTGWVGQLGQGNLAELEKLPQKVNADWIWLSQELND